MPNESTKSDTQRPADALPAGAHLRVVTEHADADVVAQAFARCRAADLADEAEIAAIRQRRPQRIVELRKLGLTYSQIAVGLGITKQRVFQLAARLSDDKEAT